MSSTTRIHRLARLALCVLISCFWVAYPVAAAEKAEILVGAPLSLTGSHAMDGLEQKWAYEQAVADCNAKGGIFIKSANKKLPVKLIIADDESEPGKAAAAMERLVKVDNVDVCLSTHSGPLNVAAAIVAEKYKKFYLMTAAFPFIWTPHNFKWSALHFFTADGAAEMPFKIWKDLLPEQDRPKNPALVMEDSVDGEGFGNGFREWAKKYGYTFAVDEPWAIGAKDYSAQILKMQAKKVDAILLYGSPTDAVTLIRQMKEIGLNVKYLHGWKGTWTSEFHQALGKDSNFVMCDGFWSEDFPYPGAKELGQRYTQKYGKYSVSIGAFYANAQILLMAIERAQAYDSETVRNTVVNGEFKGTVEGDIKFDDKGLALFTSTANQWWEGKQMLVYPPVEGGWKMKLMPAWGAR